MKRSAIDGARRICQSRSQPSGWLERSIVEKKQTHPRVPRLRVPLRGSDVLELAARLNGGDGEGHLCGLNSNLHVRMLEEREEEPTLIAIPRFCLDFIHADIEAAKPSSSFSMQPMSC
jgi:hypothetical protein